MAAAVVLLTQETSEPVETSLTVAAALSSDTSGYARATAPHAFVFPADHGPHPDYRTEWWYYTGNVVGEGDRRFAYQFTLFRTALRPADAAPPAMQPDTSGQEWSTRQLYMAHLAVTDVRSGEHVAFERFSRGAAGLAGAEADPYRIWIEDWHVDGIGGADTVRIRAKDGDTGLDLVLARTKSIVLQGDRGFDRKGPEPGNASYYFSMTRMATTGSIISGGEIYDVDGWSWMDREWSTSALSGDQVGWDWFSLQLEDGSEVMYYRLRDADGATSSFSSGSIVDSAGGVRPLSAEDVQLRTPGTWTSPTTGTEYPSEWKLEIAATGTVLDIEPLIPDQELDVSIRYWEGAVRVEGRHRGRPVTGLGFVEMTGYGEEGSP